MNFLLAISHDTTTTVLQLYNSESGDGGFSIGAFGRNSTNGLRIRSDAGSNSGNDRQQAVNKTWPSALATSYVGFSIKLSAIPISLNMPFFSLLSVGAKLITLEVRPDGTVRVINSSGTQLGVLSDFVFQSGVHYHFEVKTTVHTSTGVVQVWVNEVDRTGGGFTGKNTVGAATGATDANGHSFHIDSVTTQPAIFTWDYDDVVVGDDRLGDLEYREDLPTGTGATDQWAATGAATTREAVDESNPDEDTSYASEDTVGETSLWTYPAIPTTATVKALILSPRAKKSAAGSCIIRSVYRDAAGPSLHEGADKAPSDSSYEYHPHVFNTNPATAAAFTASEINSGQYGVKRTA